MCSVTNLDGMTIDWARATAVAKESLSQARAAAVTQGKVVCALGQELPALELQGSKCGQWLLRSCKSCQGSHPCVEIKKQSQQWPRWHPLPSLLSQVSQSSHAGAATGRGNALREHWRMLKAVPNT